MPSFAINGTVFELFLTIDPVKHLPFISVQIQIFLWLYHVFPWWQY